LLPEAASLCKFIPFETLTGDEGDDGDFDAPNIYEPIKSYEQLSDRLMMFQSQYNEVVRGSQLDLVFFKVL